MLLFLCLNFYANYKCFRSLAMEQAEDEVAPQINITTFRDVDSEQVSQSSFETETCLEALIEETDCSSSKEENTKSIQYHNKKHTSLKR